MPEISHILETPLYVSDQARAVNFYDEVMGFQKILDQDRLIGMAVGDNQHILLLFQEGASTKGEDTPGGFIPPHDGHGPLHIAFAISASKLEEWKTHLHACGVPIESIVHPPNGGTSVYFRDPDNNLLELATPGIWATY